MTLINSAYLWRWANFYENEVGLLHEGLPVTVVLPAFPGPEFGGEIGAINPSIGPVKRTATARVGAPNWGRQLWPGMYANAVYERQLRDDAPYPRDRVRVEGRPSGTVLLSQAGCGNARKLTASESE